MVDDMDMKRKKSLALVTGRADSETDGPHQRGGLQPQRSRSFKVALGLALGSSGLAVGSSGLALGSTG